MIETAIVLFVEHSGSVLATVTRTGDPAAAPAPEELAGELLPVHDDNGEVLVEIAPDELDSKAVPFDEDLVVNPQKCGFKDGEAHLLAGAQPGAVLASTGLTVTLPQAATDKTKVWAQVDFGSGQTRRHEVMKGEIAAGSDTVELAKTFAPGQDYDVLVLAAGCEPLMQADQSV